MLTAQVAVGTSERGDGKESDENESQGLHYCSREREIREVSRAGMKRSVKKKECEAGHSTWAYIYHGAHQLLEKFLPLKLDHAEPNVPLVLKPVQETDSLPCAG